MPKIYIAKFVVSSQDGDNVTLSLIGGGGPIVIHAESFSASFKEYSDWQTPAMNLTGAIARLIPGEEKAKSFSQIIEEVDNLLTFERAEEQVSRTELDPERYNDVLKRLNDPKILKTLHYIIGLTTEVGELADALKKHLFYGKPLDEINMQEEIGDVQWYGLNLGKIFGGTRNCILKVLAKLRLRYPNKFNSVDALNRDLVAERKILEGGK